MTLQINLKMKKIQLLLLLFSLSCTVRAQVVLTGNVVDASNDTPLTNVIVLLTNAKGTVVKFAQTDTKGAFTLNITDSVASSSRIQFTLMSYKKQEYALDGKDKNFHIRMEPTPTRLKEVTVKAPRIREQGDTLVYNVAGFANEQDRSIGDVLKKMPGIDVDKEGKIKYNGTDINKFYIEGKDLLEGRYGIATKGISHKDVGSVEVMENHQPIKVMEGFTYSDQAALNLKLKDKAKAKWIGNYKVQGGYAEGEGGLWNADLFGMLIKKNVQNITTLKSNNTGENITRNVRNFYADIFSNTASTGVDNYIRVDPKRMSGLEEERTLFNQSHLLSSSQLWETGKEYELKTQIDYFNNQETNNNVLNTLYFLPDSTKAIYENEQGHVRQNYLKGQITVEANKARLYLRHTLNAELQWKDIDLHTSGTLPNRQSADMPAYKIGSDFNWMQRFGKQLVTFTGNNQLHSRPQHLNIIRDGKSLYQTTDTKVFYTNENASYNLAFDRFVVSLNGGVAGLLRAMDSRLTGVADSLGKTSNDITTNYLKLYAGPKLRYSTIDWEISLNLPIDYYHYNFGNNRFSRNDVLFSPKLYVKWDITTRFGVSVSGQISPRNYDINRFFDGLILTDYRTLRKGYDVYAVSTGKSITGNIYYKNSFREWFANLSVIRSWQKTPFQSDQRFIGNFLLYAYKQQPVSSDSWFILGNASKGIGFIKGIASLHASYLRSNSSLVTENVPVSYRSTYADISMDVNGELQTWVNWYYELTYGFSGLESDLSLEERLNSWQHTLKLTFIPYKAVLLTLSGEYYHNEISRNVYKNLLMADMKLAYKWKDFECWAKIGNLFNKKEYGYNIHDELTSVSCRQQIRGREFLIGISWRK